MEISLKIVLSSPTLGQLLEPLFMYYDLGICHFPLVMYNLMQLRFLFKKLIRFHHEQLVLILKLEITSWLVMSGIRKY
jgi:hypothetical protein